MLTASLATSAQQLELLRPGTLKVAVTRSDTTDPYQSQTWIKEYVELFAAQLELEIDWVVVPFNESWLLASNDEVDFVATNVANFPDRASEGAWSERVPCISLRAAAEVWEIARGDRETWSTGRTGR